MSCNYHQQQYADHAKQYTVIFPPNNNKDNIDPKICAKCENMAIYECNLLGNGKFLCDKHTEQWKTKNSSLPTDLWFITPIKTD